MKTYLNTETGLLTLAAGATTGIAKISAKRGDLFLLEVVPSGTIEDATGVFAAKSTYSGDPVAFASSWTAPETESAGYLFSIDLNTTALNALFTSEIADVTLLAEITWSLAGAIRSTQTLSLVVTRDVWRGDEADPTAASDFKATQAEAEAGTDNVKWMSPLRTAQGIAAWVSGHASAVCSAINATVAPAWANVSGKPTIIPDAAGSIAEDGKQYARKDGAWVQPTAAGISDSTAAGRNMLTAADAAAQKTLLSLSNVNNTSDENKPVSLAQQTALDLKADKRTIQTTSFTAAINGRYTSVGTVAVTDPSGTQAGQIYTIICGSGTLTFVGDVAGITHIPSRIEVVRYYNGSAWTSLTWAGNYDNNTSVLVRIQMGWELGPFQNAGTGGTSAYDGNGHTGCRLIGTSSASYTTAAGGGIRYSDGGFTGGCAFDLINTFDVRWVFQNHFQHNNSLAFFFGPRTTAAFWSANSVGLYYVPQPAASWASGTVYTQGQYINVAGTVYVCSTAGTSGGSAPTWGTTIDGTTADNTAVWRNLGPHTSNKWALGIVDGSGVITLTNTGVACVTANAPNQILRVRSNGTNVYASVDGSTDVSVSRGSLRSLNPAIFVRSATATASAYYAGLLFTVYAPTQ